MITVDRIFPVELRCEKDEHPLTITEDADRLLRIAAPECTTGCECCQRTGSFGYAQASMFIPGR